MRRFPARLIVFSAIIASVILSVGTASAAKLRQVAILDLPGRPGFESVVFANGKLVIAHKGANTVDIFDPAKRRLVAQVSNILDPRGLAADATTGMVYIACAGSNSIAVLNSKNWQVENMISLRHTPEELLLAPQSKTLYATGPVDHAIMVVPTEGAGQVEDIDVEGKPQQMAWDAQKKVLYVTVEDRSEIAIVDPSRVTGTPNGAVTNVGQGSVSSGLARQIKLTASQPTGILFDSGSRKLYVAVRYAVIQVDPDTGTELARVPAPAGTDALWMDPATSTLYASSVDGSLVLINSTGKPVAVNEYRAEVRGHAMAVDPANKTIFLSGGREGKSKLVILKQFGLAQSPVEKTESAAAMAAPAAANR